MAYEVLGIRLQVANSWVTADIDSHRTLGMVLSDFFVFQDLYIGFGDVLPLEV